MRDRWQVVSRLALRDPRLLIEYFQMSARSRLGSEEQREPAHITTAIDPAQARLHLAATVGAWSDGAALELVRRHRQLDAAGRAGATAERVAGDADIAELLYGLVRALRPEVVVETGVATGVTSAYLLAALADNDAGELQSIDLPSADLVRAELVGCAVPGRAPGSLDLPLGDFAQTACRRSSTTLAADGASSSTIPSTRTPTCAGSSPALGGPSRKATG